MKNVTRRLFELMRKGELKFLWKGISKRIFSRTETFGLKRNLSVPFPIPNAKIDIAVRLFRTEDQQYFGMDLQNDGLLEKAIPNCYVATTIDDIPCFRQWLIGPKHKLKIKEFWGESFPDLKDDEMLLEHGFTVPEMRGNGIMPAAVTRIIENEKRPEIKWVITFVGINNIPSLKGIHRSGFSPYVLRTDTWFLFRRKVGFGEVPEALIQDFFKKVSSST